jgi:hypothetical protein
MVTQSGSTSVLGHTFGIDDDVLLPVPAGSGSSRSSSESRQHDGVVAMVVENSGRALPKRMRELRWRRRRLGFGEAARVWALAMGQPTCGA